MRFLLAFSLLLGGLAAACAPAAPSPGGPPRVLRLATTTSTADSGLLDALLPGFESAHDARVDVIAVGTGQALALGEQGDVDVVLVHARAREDAFVAGGHGLARLDVMYNDYVLVGPVDDPAGIGGMATAEAALARLAAARAAFVSRGDDSGTHTKEVALWQAAGLGPAPGNGWYRSIGQGMGETLLFANEAPAYTLTDRATWLAQQARLPKLALLVGGASLDLNPDPALLNPYGVIAVNPQRHPAVAAELAEQFIQWLTALDTQRQIAAFGLDTYGQPLFYPNSEAWVAAQR